MPKGKYTVGAPAASGQEVDLSLVAVDEDPTVIIGYDKELLTTVLALSPNNDGLKRAQKELDATLEGADLSTKLEVVKRLLAAWDPRQEDLGPPPPPPLLPAPADPRRTFHELIM